MKQYEQGNYLVYEEILNGCMTSCNEVGGIYKVGDIHLTLSWNRTTGSKMLTLNLKDTSIHCDLADSKILEVK